MHIKINVCIYTRGYVCVCIQGPGEREGNCYVLGMYKCYSFVFPHYSFLVFFPFILLHSLSYF